MVCSRLKVEGAAFAVGYESPSPFSREYARMFGAPPRRDLRRMQTALSAERTQEGGLAIARDAA
jgi:transcriptional regulator GlxA family with amidase domain